MRTLSAGRASLLSTMQPEQLASHATCEWTKHLKPVQSSSACMWRCWVCTVIACAVHYSMICAEESQVLLSLCRSPCSKQLLSASARTLLQVCAGLLSSLACRREWNSRRMWHNDNWPSAAFRSKHAWQSMPGKVCTAFCTCTQMHCTMLMMA